MHRYTPKLLDYSRALSDTSGLGRRGLGYYIIIEYHRMQIIASIFIEYSIYTMGVGISMQVSNRISRKWLSAQIGVA